MRRLTKKAMEKHEAIKDSIENSYEYFRENYDRFNDYTNFVFVSTISDAERALLRDTDKPELEFNILEAYVSRLRGEFSKNEPSIEVSAKDGREVDPKVIEAVEGHMRYILQEANKNGLEYHTYTDTLTGGFSVFKVYSDYVSEMSFNQDIFLKRAFDPTLVGFDPMAQLEDKSDGDYCFEVFPMSRDAFERQYPDIKLSGVKFGKSSTSGGSGVGPFKWSYENGKQEYLLVADYYEKVKTKKKIVLLSDGQVMTRDEYKEFLQFWEDEGIIAQPPSVVGKPRNTEICKIVRYRVIESQVIDEQQTDFKRLPLIFVDGNSVTTKEHGMGSVKQVTRPYVYHAKGAQKFKNLCGITLAFDIQNMGPNKIIASIDSIPEGYLEMYKEPQKHTVIPYNAFKDNDPNVALSPPQMPPRVQTPPEVTNAFVGSDDTIQNILGSFDASLARLTQDQVSGVAIQESATLGNAAAMPYIESFMRGLQSAAQLIIEMIPLYYLTPRTIPVINKLGQKSFVKINDKDGIDINYDHDDLQISVEPGVSFSMQQTRSLQQITALMNTSPVTAQFINEMGLDIIFDNVNQIRNVEELRERAEIWMAQKEQEKQQMMQQAAQQPNMEQMALEIANKQIESEHQAAMSKLQVQSATEQAKLAMKQSEVDIKRAESEVDVLKVLADIQIEMAKLRQSQDKLETEAINNAEKRAIEATKVANEHADKQLQAAADVMDAASKMTKGGDRPDDMAIIIDKD